GAHRRGVARDVGRDFAVERDPVVGAVEAFEVPLAARLELRREARLLELQHIDASLVVNHLVTDRELGRADVEHAIIVSNIGTNSKLIYAQNHPDLPSLHVASPYTHPSSRLCL